MSKQYVKAAKAINEVALFLATDGYHVMTTFGRYCDSMEVVVFFHNIENKKKIEHLLNCYTKQNDKVEFNELSFENGVKFYTLKLIKDPS